MKGSLKGAYRRGRLFEWEVKRALEPLGYYVQRAPRSGGIVDLLCVRSVARGEVLFCQLKTDGSLPPGKWNALWQAAYDRQAIPILVLKDREGRIGFRRLVAPKQTKPRVAGVWETFTP